MLATVERVSKTCHSLVPTKIGIMWSCMCSLANEFLLEICSTCTCICQYSTSSVIQTAISVIQAGESARGQKSLVLVFIATHIISLDQIDM